MILTLLIFFVVITANKFDYMSPSVLFVFPLLISIMFAMIYADDWGVNLHLETTCLLLFGFILFFIGERLGKKAPRIGKNSISTDEKPLKIRKYKYAFIIIYQLIAFAMYVHAISSQVGSLGTVYVMFDSTYAKEASKQVGFVVASVFRLSAVFAYLCALDMIFQLAEKSNDKLNIINDSVVIFIYCLTILVSGSRGDVMNFAVSILFMWYIIYCKKNGWKIKNIKKTLKKIIPLTMSVLIAFFLLKNIVKKAGQGSANFMSVVSSYMGAQIDLLDRLITHNKFGISYDYFGYESFYNLYQFLYKIGIVENCPSISFPYRAYNQIGCNVYTYFKRPYVDFGFAGCLLITMICGFVFGYFYYKNIKNSRLDKNALNKLAVYSYFVSKLVMAFFDDYITIQISATAVEMLVFFMFGFKFLFNSKVRFTYKVSHQSWMLESKNPRIYTGTK